MKFLFAIYIAVILVPGSLLAKEYPGSSLYHLKGVWLDPDSDEKHLNVLEGRIALVAMVYTTCQYSCPLIIEEFNKIKSKLSPEVLAKINFVLISMDPEADTPAALKAFATKRKLDLSLWRLFTAKEAKQVREFAAAIGGNFKKVGKDFVHSNAIIVLDHEGVIKFTKTQIGQQIDETAQTARSLAGKLPKL